MMRKTLVLVMFALALVMSAASAQQTTIILVRHAEKVDDSGDAHLSEPGKARAARLADMLRHAGVRAIYSTPYARTRNTALPLAEALDLQLILTPISGDYAKGLAERIMRETKGATVLVVGHSNTTPDVVKALGAPAVPAIPDSEYDNLYIVQVDAQGKASVIRAKY